MEILMHNLNVTNHMHMFHLTSCRTIWGNLNAITSTNCILRVRLISWSFLWNRWLRFFSVIYWLVYLKIAQKKQKLLVVDKTAKRCSKVAEHRRVGRDRPQHSVVIMSFKCKKLFRYFFSLFTIFHLWLTIIRCQEPINGSQRCLCEAFFFLKKMKAVFKGGIILNMFRTFETGCSQRIIFT